MWLVGEGVDGNTLEFWPRLPGGRFAERAQLIFASDAEIDDLVAKKDELNKQGVKPRMVYEINIAEF